MQYAVLTGDIVDSSALSAGALDGVMATIETASAELSSWDHADTGFARRGGDAWQLAIPCLSHDLRAALYVRARVRRDNKSVDTRIAIARGIGTVPDGGDTNSAHGPAFTSSGRLLDNLPPHALMSHADGGAQAATVLLADRIAHGWTQAQARALCEMLPPDAGPRAEAAKRLGVSRQAVDQALHAAGFPAIEAALNAWEAE